MAVPKIRKTNICSKLRLQYFAASEYVYSACTVRILEDGMPSFIILFCFYYMSYLFAIFTS